VYDLAYFRANLDAIAKRLATRGNALNLDQLRDLDTRRRNEIAFVESLKRQRNEKSSQIAQLKQQGADTASEQAEVRAIAAQISQHDDLAKGLDE
jgi:seryl-tRNA synthetase